METATAIAVFCIVFGGFASQWIAWRIGIPAIALLLLVGLSVGPFFQLVDPGTAFESTLQPIISLCVAIVLFEGGLALNFKELRAAGSGIRRLTLVALPLNWLLAFLAGYYIAGMSVGIAILFGAILTVTGPTVIIPLLRQARLKQRPASFLKWEGIVNDPIGALAAAVTLEILILAQYPDQGVGSFFGVMVLGIVVALGLGLGSAFLVRWSFARDAVPEILKMPMLLSFVLTMHSLSNVVLHEAGLIAVTVFGVALANMNIAGLAELTRFKETLVVMIVSALFIILGSDLDPQVLSQVSLPLIGVTLAIVFLVRPAAIMLATIRSGMTWQERVLVSWIGPRGIVAAAISGLAALKLMEYEYPTSELLQPAVFAVIAATVLLHGFSMRPLARWLGLTTTVRPSLAIIGASPWSTDLATTLHGMGVPITLVDTHKNALKDARREGVTGLQIEALAEKGEEAFHKTPHDYVIAATPDEIYNALICANLAPEIGRERVFQIAAGGGRLMDERRGLSRDVRGKIWADGDINFEGFETRHKDGWRFLVSDVTEALAVEDVPRSEHVVPVLIVHANDMLSPVSPEGTGGPGLAEGDKIVNFAAPQSLRAVREPADDAGEGAPVDPGGDVVTVARVAVD